MKRLRLDEIQGNEVLARPLMTWDYQIILPEGTLIRKEHIAKLGELGILEVYVREDETGQIAILKSELEGSFHEKVRDILERHTYHNNQDLEELSRTADSIISTILEEEHVVERVFDIRERNSDIYEHSINICVLAILTSLKLNLDREKIHDIGVGCLLHDIGMRYTTLDFKEKDVASLSDPELAEFKKHPVIGYTSLKDEEWISDISKYIILYHHERMDGSGFPLHIRDIPFECRIVNVCDAFDEMICGITRKRTKVYEAIEYLKSFQNVKFDGKIVNVFLTFTAVYPAGSQVITNEGDLAVVISQNKDFQDRPVIRVLRDKNGKRVEGEKIIDLVKVHHVFIDKVLE